ncbi:hypothetical protein AX17_001831 [Amanita inopinata Kibby_2008]|nr:hypothetical protein AX17_001831 [Amanita inopinata Kibby_2008]
MTMLNDPLPCQNDLKSLLSIPDMPHSSNTQKTSTTVKRLTWGIFDIAYVPVRPPNFPRLSLDSFFDLFISSHYMLRLFFEVYGSSRLNTILFVLCHVWLCIGPVLSLYLASQSLHILANATSAQIISGTHDQTYRFPAFLWLACVSLSTFVRRRLEAVKHCLAGHLRHRIVPQLAAASLRGGMNYVKRPHFRSAFPELWTFGAAPEMDILRDFFTRSSDILRVLLEVPVVVWILCQTGDRAARLFAIIGICMITFSIHSPTNCIGGAGYTFWTTHPAFHRLHALYSMIFDSGFRETVSKDGISSRLEEEFKEASDGLGPHDIDTRRLAGSFRPIPWYWELGQNMILDNSMVICATVLIWSTPSSALYSVALIQYTTNMMRSDFYRLRGGYNVATLREILKRAESLYETIEYKKEERGSAPYPSSTSSSTGMKITFKNVSVDYKGELNSKIVNAVRGVSLDINSGQLVVVVGRNGSGKSSLLKLLPNITERSSGEVLIDDIPIVEYDINQIRNSMAFLLQDEKLYPLSLHDNMLMGLTEPAWRCRLQQSKGTLNELVDRASLLGGSWSFMRELGHDKVLNPVGVTRQSTAGAGNGKIGEAAYEELRRNALSVKPHNISAGERQRLLVTRTITRVLDNDSIKLIVIDEPSSALDPIAERDLFSNFIKMRQGRTIIFVTHRFRHLVEHADLILCMDNGEVVERGTHAELIQRKYGTYSRLYNAQVHASTQ